MKKSMEEKLAASVRQVKKSQQTPATTTTVSVEADPRKGPAARPPGGVLTPVAEYAGHSDQVPAPSLDDPWGNLYPKRIWPD